VIEREGRSQEPYSVLVRRSGRTTRCVPYFNKATLEFMSRPTGRPVNFKYVSNEESASGRAFRHIRVSDKLQFLQRGTRTLSLPSPFSCSSLGRRAA